MGVIETTLQDALCSLRMLHKHPGFSAVAVMTLALGIGANTAIFSLLDAVMFRFLPVERPEQLVLPARQSPQGNQTVENG